MMVETVAGEMIHDKCEDTKDCGNAGYLHPSGRRRCDALVHKAGFIAAVKLSKSALAHLTKSGNFGRKDHRIGATGI